MMTSCPAGKVAPVLRGDPQILGQHLRRHRGRGQPHHRPGTMRGLPCPAQRVHRGGLPGPCRPHQHIHDPARDGDRRQGCGLVLAEHPTLGIGAAGDGLDNSEVDARASRRAGPLQEAVFGGEEGVGGEHGRVLRPKHASAIQAAELQRTGHELGWGQAQGRLLGSISNHRSDDFAILHGGEPPPHRLAGGFGHQVPAPPRRTLLTDHVDHRPPHLLDQIQRHIISPQQHLPLPTRDAPRPHRRIIAGDSAGAGAPLGCQLRQRADLLLWAGRECGLGAQPDHGGIRWLPAVGGYVLGHQPVLLHLDLSRPRGELRHQVFGDIDDRP